MPTLAIGQALRRQRQLATLDALVERYDKIRASQLPDIYDTALCQLRSICLHPWHILFLRRNFLEGSDGGKDSYRVLFTRHDVIDKLLALLNVYSAILSAQAEEVGDITDFENKLFGLIEVLYNTGAKHVHYDTYPGPSGGWASVNEYQNYLEHEAVLRNPRKGKIGLRESHLNGAADLLFGPVFTVTVPANEAKDGLEREVPLTQLLDIAVGLLEKEDIEENAEDFIFAMQATTQANDLDRLHGQIDRKPLLAEQLHATAFEKSEKKTLSIRPLIPGNVMIESTSPAPSYHPGQLSTAVPSPQQRKPPPKLRLFRGRTEEPASTPEAKPSITETQIMHPERRSSRVRRETEIMMAWKTERY